MKQQQGGVDVIARLQQSDRGSLRDGRQLIWEVLQQKGGEAGTGAMNVGQNCKGRLQQIKAYFTPEARQIGGLGLFA